MKIQIFYRGLLSFVLVALCVSATVAQIKVGDNPTTLNSAAVLELESTNQGLLLPRVSLAKTQGTATEIQMGGAKVPVTGMTVYNTNAGITGTATYPANGAGIYYFDGTGWIYGGLPTGGTTGQVLSKNANNNGLSWATPASGIVTYSVGSATGAGAIIKATGIGVTMTVTPASQLVTFNVPNGVELMSIRLYDMAATATATSYGLTGTNNFLNIRYVFPTNATATGIANSYTTTILPQIQVFLNGGTPYYTDTFGSGAARQYTLSAPPALNTYTVRVQGMSPNILGNTWTVLMNF